jgi:hypothetical protein
VYGEPDNQNPVFGCGEQFVQHDAGIAGTSSGIGAARDHLNIGQPSFRRPLGGDGLE